MFMVKGGEYADTTFTTLVGEPEVYGPFSSYEKAQKGWFSAMWRNVDVCNHRLFIVEA